MHLEAESQTATDETLDAGVSQQDVSPVCNGSYNIDCGVSQDYALPSNIDPSNSKTDFTMQPFAIELLCGSAGLTAAMRTLMPSSFGVDHNVVRPKSRVIQLNLLDETNQKLVLQWAKHPNCLWLHFGVPCGAASRAREVRLNRYQHGPPPLRDGSHPDGLPACRLSAKNLLRVRSANRLYRFMMELILNFDANKIWTIENPYRSWLWATSYVKTIRNRIKTYFGRFDMCMFGGRRFKKTGIQSNSKHVMSFQLLCNNKHEHLPFKVRGGKFDTSKEAEYPTKFCRVLTQAVAEDLSLRFGVVWNFKQLKSSVLAAVAAGKQPKSLPNLVHEFAAVVPIHDVPSDVSFSMTGKQQLKRCYKFVSNVASNDPICVHRGAKLLRRTEKRVKSDATATGTTEVRSDITLDLSDNPMLDVFPGSEVPQMSSVDCNGCHQSCDDCVEARLGVSEARCDAVFGLPWEPVAFLHKACGIGHPQNIILGLSTEVREAVKNVAKLSTEQIITRRGKWLQKYLAEARSLEPENRKILDTMPCEMRAVMKSKRLAVLRKILVDHDYPDLRIVDDMISGLELVGEAPSSNGVLPQKFSPANLHVDELVSSAPMAREACRLTTKSSGCDETDRPLWSKTLEERDKGWLLGPLDWDALDPDTVVSRRFPLQQGSKIRPIDDYSMSSVNATVGTTEQATTDSIDVISSMLAELMKQLTRCGKDTQVLARSFDLSAAYRQLCVAPSSYKFSHICVYDPISAALRVFRQVCLPFGSRSAVNAFIRCARCIQWPMPPPSYDMLL